MTRRYRNQTGYPLIVPGLPEPLPDGGEVDEDQIALSHDPEAGGSVTGLTLLAAGRKPKPAPEPDPPPKPARTAASTDDMKGDTAK